MSHEDKGIRSTTWWAPILRGKVAISRFTEASVPLDLRKYLLTPRPGTVLAMSVPAETLSPTFSLL